METVKLNLLFVNTVIDASLILQPKLGGETAAGADFNVSGLKLLLK